MMYVEGLDGPQVKLHYDSRRVRTLSPRHLPRHSGFVQEVEEESSSQTLPTPFLRK